ncbi:MAG: hypothetical protein A3F91_09220 [Flavobacteria bacterium RIFCSPLOWO2_12_FULL_35_11]|nr:MAG: hypothetical protein A3F91_09220 [Flavobacteria bacterium RIFCSPLOWO2_12_FULL_35_11]
MFIKNNGVAIEVNNDGSFIFAGKTYHDDKNQHLKNIEDKLVVFADSKYSINYDDIPKRLKEKINRTLNTIYSHLDKKRDEDVVALNRLKDFGFLEDDYERIKRVSKNINNIAFGMGLGNAEASYDRYKKQNPENRSIFGFHSAVKGDLSVERDKIAVFVENFKKKKLNDFTFFSETLQDFGISDTKEVLSIYNDSIDSVFVIGTKDYAVISVAKKEFMDLQAQVIKDAVESGYGVPIDLPRFVSPSDKINDETINPQKVKMIRQFDFTKNQVGYKSDAFMSNGDISPKVKSLLSDNIKTQIKILNMDTNNSLGMINLQLIKNNGFSFDKMKDWALYSGDNDIINPQKAMGVAITGLKQCNKLVECGILQSSDNKNYSFTTPRAREILLENPAATYNELADIMIKEHEITFAGVEKPINKELFDSEKADFEGFLDAQFKSYYVPQGLGIDAFRTDALVDESQERQRMRDFYPELQRGAGFDAVLSDFFDKREFDFIRTPSLNFSDKRVVDAISKEWSGAQQHNRNNKNEISQNDFINISAVKFDGISVKSLNNWKESVIAAKSLSKDEADGFVEASLSRGEALVLAGLMVKAGKDYKFLDGFSKEILYKNYKESLAGLQELNKGVKVSKPVMSPVNTVDTSVGVLQSNRELTAALADFNYAWSLSGDEKYKRMMGAVEFDLTIKFKEAYATDEHFKTFVHDMLKREDSTGVRNAFYNDIFEQMSEESDSSIEDISKNLTVSNASDYSA